MQKILWPLLLLLTHLPVMASEIRVGMSTALTGPASQLGTHMRLGIEACFDAVNRAGGIAGRKLTLQVLDDGYEPERAAPNMRALIEEHQVLAVLGNVGTPTAIVTRPIANESGTLLFGAFSGARVLRQVPPERYIINYRASYDEEVANMITGLLGEGISAGQIAFFTQRDGYGDAVFSAAVQALAEHGYDQADSLLHVRYTRNTLNVENAVAALLDATTPPRAVIMASGYAAASKFTRLLWQELPEVTLISMSFVGSQALLNELGEQGDGLIVTQVVPHFDSTLPIVRQYRQDLRQYDAQAEPGFVSLEGYIVGRIFVEALYRSGSVITRESIVEAMESLQGVDIGLGIPISYSASQHQAIHQVWPTRIDEKRFIPTDWQRALR